MHTSLVIMAAGLASRYGGNKQIAGMGPHGEILLEYSVHDAIRAGFDRVVFIIRPDMEAAVRKLCGDRLSKKIEVFYAFQDFSSIPGCSVSVATLIPLLSFNYRRFPRNNQ